MGLEKIIEFKRILNLTTEELSKKSGVPIGTLNKILSGATKDPKLETLKSIARVLGLSLNDFDDGISAPRDEADLLTDYRKLNSLGKEKARGDVSDLTQIPKYTGKVVPFRREEPLVEAAHYCDDHDPEGDAHDDAIMDDENF